MSIWDQLKQYEEAFKNAEVEENSYDDLPDGKYVVRINRAAVEESKATSRPQMVWELVVGEGNYTGRYIWKYSGLDSAEKITWLKQDLFRVGHPLEKLADLEGLLPKLLDNFVKVTLKTKTNDKGSFQNVYFNGPVAADQVPKKTGQAPVLTDKDLPF